MVAAVGSLRLRRRGRGLLQCSQPRRRLALGRLADPLDRRVARTIDAHRGAVRRGARRPGMRVHSWRVGIRDVGIRDVGIRDVGIRGFGRCQGFGRCRRRRCRLGDVARGCLDDRRPGIGRGRQLSPRCRGRRRCHQLFQPRRGALDRFGRNGPIRRIGGIGRRHCANRRRRGRHAVGLAPETWLRGHGADRVEIARLEACLDDLERQEVVTLLSEYPAEPSDVGVVELPIPGRRALGHDQPLRLQEADLRDRHVGEFGLQQREHLADGEMTRYAVARRSVTHRHHRRTRPPA